MAIKKQIIMITVKVVFLRKDQIFAFFTNSEKKSQKIKTILV